MAFDAGSEVRHLVGTVVDRKGPREFLDVDGSDGRMLDADGALDAQLLCAPRKPGDPDVIAESVLNEAQAPRLRTDVEVRVDQALIVAVARSQHHPVLTEG